MGSFKLGKMTLRSLIKKPETLCYPYVTKEFPEDIKGHIEVDMAACTLCSVCQKRCPTGAITVDRENKTWSINPYDCIQCRTCVRECSQQCLTMAPEMPRASAKKVITVVSKPEPTEEEKAEMAKKEAEKAAKIKAALEAKALREAKAKAEAE